MTRCIAWRIGACVLIISVSCGCRDYSSVPEMPLSVAERVQFESPLQLAGWQESGSWPQFAHDPLHSGRTDVDLNTSELQLLWQYRPTEHIWSYEEGYSVWSSPVMGTIAGRTLVIAGHYDGVVYAVDAETGQHVWDFRPGNCVFASPALGQVGGDTSGGAMVFVASINRSIYGLDAATGEKVWSVETMPWSFTAAPSLMSSPTLVRQGNTLILLVGVWNSDRSATRNVQAGDLIALNAADGEELWRRRLASVPICSPAVAQFGNEVLIFVTAHHGGMWALRLADGSTVWEAVLNEDTRSSPSLGVVGDFARLCVGTRFHSMYCLDPRNGGKLWRKQTGYWIDATPAWFESDGGTMVVAGSYDRHVHSFRGLDGDQPWQYKTGNFAYSSGVSALLDGKRVVLTMSWDEHVYMLDGATGTLLWKAKSGPLLWSHAFQGDSLWASPVVGVAGEKPIVVAAAFDGVLYAYGPKDD